MENVDRIFFNDSLKCTSHYINSAAKVPFIYN